MNRRERRAQWLAHHRGDAGASDAARASGREPHRDSPAASREAHPAHGHDAMNVESDAVSQLESPPIGSVRLHIEEVVLRGFDPRGRYAVGDAVQHELARLLNERGVPSSLGTAAETTERLDAGVFRVASSARPQNIGAQVARAVYGGLKR